MDEKHKLLGNVEKILKIFKNFLKKIAKMHYFSIFFKRLTNHALNFCAFGRKTQIVGKFWENFENFWWKFYRKLHFYFIFILENLLVKIEPSEITPFFYNNFSVWVGEFPLSPWLRLCYRPTAPSGSPSKSATTLFCWINISPY